MASFERILLTGGTGFVGSYLAPILAEDFPAARRLALRLRRDEGCEVPCWSEASCNLLDADAVDEIAAQLRPDLVVHLAGQASVGKALGEAEATWRANFLGGFNLASALARHAPTTTVLFASSVAVYGASLKDGVAHEETPLRPLDAYGRSKAAAEWAFSDVLPPEARLIVARPVNHSGPRQSEKSFALASFAAQIAQIEAGRKAPMLRVGNLLRARDFLDVRDVVDAYRGLIAEAPRLPNRNVFNVASGESRVIGELVEEMRRRARTSFTIETDQKLLRPASVDIPEIVCSAEKLRETTGWRPRRTIHELLQSLLDHWRGKESATV